VICEKFFETTEEKMKTRLVLVSLAVLIALSSVLALAGDPAMPMGKSNAAFDRMKSLVGEWQGTMPDGKPVTVSYSLVSGGTALMERLAPGTETEMVTMYTADGDDVMMTHYCDMNNQPRMKASKPSAGAAAYTFNYVDATNLSSPKMPHMQKLVTTFKDSDHITQEWALGTGSGEQKEVFSFARKK
jgi:hypothetical protein